MKRLIVTLIIGISALAVLAFAFVGFSGPQVVQHEIVKDIDPKVTQ